MSGDSISFDRKDLIYSEEKYINKFINKYEWVEFVPNLLPKEAFPTASDLAYPSLLGTEPEVSYYSEVACPVDWVVRPRDTIWDIAQTCGVDTVALVAANPQVTTPDTTGRKRSPDGHWIYAGDVVYTGSATAAPTHHLDPACWRESGRSYKRPIKCL